MNADDIKYILAEEGRYYEDYDIMNEGIEAIDIDEMNGEEEPPAKKVASDPHFGDYSTPDDVKARGGVNYHINKQKTKSSPKSERRRLREKRTKDLPAKESRCHKKAGVNDL